MPKVANGIDLEWNLRRAHAENVEFELRRSLLPHRDGVVRLLGYVNHANMGSYRDAINDFLAGRMPLPDIAAHPRRTTRKYGFGVNLEQDRKSTRLNSSHGYISYAVFCLKKKKKLQVNAKHNALYGLLMDATVT